MTDVQTADEIKPVEPIDDALPQWMGPPRLDLIKGEWLSIASVAFGCRVSEQTVRNWLEREVNPLRAFQFPGRVAIKVSDLAEFLTPAPYVPAKKRA